MRALLDDPAGSGQESGLARSLQPLRGCGCPSRRKSMTPRDQGLMAAAAALVADQGSKLLLLYAFGFAGMSPFAHIDILPFFNLVMVWNRGVSYGLFPASGPG